jgi:NCS1 family nucleobase:cation symporter-1
MTGSSPDAASAPGDLHYRDKVASVEPYGVDAIPDAERHGKATSQLYIWFAAGMNFPIMVLGFYALSMGLSLTSAITAILVGSFGGSLVMGVLSRMGGRLGVAQQIQARGPLGFFGNFVPVAYVNVFAGIGWAAVTVILGAQAAHSLVNGIPFWLAGLVLVVLQLVVAIYGYNMIHYLQRILAFVLFAGFVMITIAAIHRGWHGYTPSAAGAASYGHVGGWITFMGYFLSFLIAWWPFASDYSRYLPDNNKVSRATGFWTFAGNFLSLSWLGIVGALLGGSAASGQSPIDALHTLTGSLATPALLAILLSSFSQNFLNVYGGAISIQTLRIPVSRRTAVIVICAVAYAISLWANTGFEYKFKNFLFLGAYLIAPFGAILLLDWVLNKRYDRSKIGELYDPRRVLEWGFVAWLAGSLASMPFWELSFYTGPVARANPHLGDLSYFVGFAVGAVVFIFVNRLPPLWHRHGHAAGEAARSRLNSPSERDAELL